jgi:hypothetical protein
MVYFYTKNATLAKFWRTLERKMLVYFMTIWKNVQPLGIFYAQLVYIFRGQSVLFPVLVHFAKKHLATLLWTE